MVASPFQMARVAATVAAGGMMPQGRWITDETNTRTNAPQAVLSPESAQTLGRFMRNVVTSGTGRRAAGGVPVAGKTGTAELAGKPSHAWFIGFAPYGGAGARSRSRSWWKMECTAARRRLRRGAEIAAAAAKLGLIQP